MAYQVLFTQLAFQKTKADQPNVADGPETIVKRGELVPEWAPAAVVSALATAGMVVYAADPLPNLVPVGSEPAQVRTPDQPAILPSDPNGTAPVLGDLFTETVEPSTTGGTTPVVVADPVAAPLPAMPKANDSKEAWEQYATHPQIGMTLGDAEAMNKQDLMSEVKRRHAEATK